MKTFKALLLMAVASVLLGAAWAIYDICLGLPTLSIVQVIPPAVSGAVLIVLAERAP